MKIKETIINIFPLDKPISLKDIYILLPNIKPYLIRSVINTEIKKNRTFERMQRGLYKLKNE